jgi:hypothetical protein
VGTKTLARRDAIISAVNGRYWRQTHKYGIWVPKSIKEAFSIDEENGDHRWAESIQKEMNNVRVAFWILEEGEEVPPTYRFMKGHLVFDVKFDEFRFKSRKYAACLTLRRNTLQHMLMGTRDANLWNLVLTIGQSLLTTCRHTSALCTCTAHQD